jgi:hypothetical protein
VSRHHASWLKVALRKDRDRSTAADSEEEQQRHEEGERCRVVKDHQRTQEFVNEHRPLSLFRRIVDVGIGEGSMVATIL